jgi:hypothetical protein
MDLLASSVVGHLVAALQKRTLETLGPQIWQGVGTTTQTAAEQLQALVVNRLQDDPAVRRILNNAGKGLEANRRTIRRVELALEEKVFEDVDYAVELRLAVERLETGRSAWAGRIAFDSGTCASVAASPPDSLTAPESTYPSHG